MGRRDLLWTRFLSLCLLLAGIEAASAVTVMPPPRHVAAGEGSATLAEKTVIVIAPGATATERYAAETLKGDLQARFGVAAAVEDKGEPRAGAISIGTAETFPALAERLDARAREGLGKLPQKEGYVIELASGASEPEVRIVGSDPVGALYGCFTFIQLLSKKDGRLVLPSPLYVEDWPVMEIRGYPWFTRDPKDLDWMARWRMNAQTYKHFYPHRAPKEGWEETLHSEVPGLIEECRRRGILFYGGTAQRWVLDHWKRHPERYKDYKFLTSDERTVALVRRMFEQFGLLGVDGFVLMLDDIAENVPPEELGREHVQWVRIMKEVARQHGVKRLLMCPTHYWKGWKASYYKPFLEATDLDDVGMIFCPYDAKEIAAVEKAGLRNYEWWHNGVWPLGHDEWVKPTFAGLMGGLNHVEWGWYGEVEFSEDLLRELQTLPARTRRAWGNVHNPDLSWPVWGSYLWDPARYDTEKSERAMADVLFGAGAEGPYMEAMNHIRGWAQRLATPEGTGEEFEKDTERMRAVVAQLKAIVDQTERPGLLPIEKRRNYWWLIDADLRILEEKAFKPTIAWEAETGAGAVAVKIACRRSGVELRYTLDGSEPTTASSLYTEPFRLDRSAPIDVKVFKNGEEKSRSQMRLHKHDANGCRVNLAHPYSPKYQGGGEGGLTDGVRGSAQFSDGRWQGFEQDDLIATVDLGRDVAVRDIRAGFLQAVGPWIFLPTGVEFFVSKDGETFQSVGTVENTVPNDKAGEFVKDFGVTVKDQTARYVRVRARNIGLCPEGHPGAKEKAWVFVDEILVNSDESLF